MLLSRDNLTRLISAYVMASLVAMAPMSITGTAVAIAGLFHFLKKASHRNDRSLKTYLALSGAILAATLASVVSSRFFPLSFNSETVHTPLSDDLIGTFKLWHLWTPVAFAAAWSSLGGQQRSKVLYLYLAAFASISIIGLQQRFSGWPSPRVLAAGLYHAQAFLNFHLSYASILAFPFFLLLAPMITRKIQKKWLCGIWMIAGVALTFTYSRGLWLALPVGVMIVGLLEIKRPFIKLSLIITMFLAGTFFLQLSSTQKRINQHGITPRIALWNVHFELFKNRPVFGVGFRKNTELVGLYNKHFPSQQYDFIVSHAHSNWIEVLTGTGIVGFAAWLAWWAWIFRMTWSLGPNPTPSGFRRSGFLAAFVVFHINGLTQVNFWEGKVSHSWGIAIGLLLGELILIQMHKEQTITSTL